MDVRVPRPVDVSARSGSRGRLEERYFFAAGEDDVDAGADEDVDAVDGLESDDPADVAVPEVDEVDDEAPPVLPEPLGTALADEVLFDRESVR